VGSCACGLPAFRSPRRRAHDREHTVIASGLTFPTAMTFGPDSALYVSNVGFGFPSDGEGQILKITVPVEVSNAPQLVAKDQ
jgi:hypothetical protein